MAKKRMLSTQIIDSDAFLDMPSSTQNLYFHLVMRADDEGFVGNPKKVMRMVGASDDDMKVLVAKRFILTFDSGVIVIKHWLIHNAIRLDRFNETSYQDEKKLLITKENKAYTELNKNGNQMATIGSPKRNETKLNEVNLNETKEVVASDKSVFGEFKNVLLKEEEIKKLIDTYGEKNTNILIEQLSAYMASKKKHYASHYATLLNWARRKIEERNLQTKKRTII